jgi:hypothetical protein
MLHDPAVVQPDERVLEPAPATSWWTRLSRLAAGQRGYRGGPSSLAAWLLVAVATVGMLASTPTSAGPDEPVQEVTAWYMSGHGLPPGPDVSFSVPASLWVGNPRGNGDWVQPCFAPNPLVNASCMPPRSTTGGTVTVTTNVNYPPPYYWVVGAGERLAALFGNEYADVGGRLASVFLNLGVLLLLSLWMRRRNPRWGNFLLLVSTPMAVFMGFVVNPSGWEITCGLVMAAALSEAAWGRDGRSDVWPKTTTAILALASLGLCTARPIGFVWALGLALAAIVLAPQMIRRTFLRVSAAVAPGIAVGTLWYLTHPALATLHVPGTIVRPATIPHLALWFVESLLFFPVRLQQMFGILGWLDTPIPPLLLLINIVAWAILLTRLPSIRAAAMTVGIFGVVIVPSAIEALGWGGGREWWQGRYTLPFALGFVLLLLLRSGRLSPRLVTIVSAISIGSLGLMVWVNAARYAFGLNAFELPLSVGHPGIGVVQLAISVAAGALLVLVGAYLLVRGWLMAKDVDPVPVPVGSGLAALPVPTDT